MPVKRFIMIAAAVILSFSMLVSAVTIAYNIYAGMYMLPNIGLFDGFNEDVRTMPQALEFGGATIEMAMTYERDGVNTLHMAIYGEGGGNADKWPAKDDYQNLEIIFSDGASVQLTGEIYALGKRSSDQSGNYYSLMYKNAYESFSHEQKQNEQKQSGSSYFFVYKYTYENFPHEQKFTVTNPAGMSTKVTLMPIEAKNIKITDNGLKRVKIIPAAEKSRIFSYNVEVIQPSLAEKAATGIFYSIGSSWMDNSVSEIIYKDGTAAKWTAPGGGTMVPIFAADENADYKYYIFGESYFDYDFAKAEIDKIKIRALDAHLTYNDDDSVKINLPIPEDGERFDYETPLEIDIMDEFTLAVGAIERERNNLLVYTPNNGLSYSGSEDIYGISFTFADSSRSSRETDDVVYTIKIPEGHSGDTLKTTIRVINYTIRGYWEVDFG
jgi:hypothetical protein